jgi:hypothetical protein
MAAFPLSCACGALQGELSEPLRGNRAVCYCDDCQAFARWLGRDDILDQWGGTDVFQVAPAKVRLTAGLDHLQLVRLSPKGLLRWYAGCCRTPVGNMLSNPRSPFVGLIHTFMDHKKDGAPRDARIGPPVGHIQGRFAVGGCPPHAHPSAGVGVIAKSVWFLLGNAVTGGHRPTPFFDDAGRPVRDARVLTKDERAAVTPKPAAG